VQKTEGNRPQDSLVPKIRRVTDRKYRILLVVMLVILSVQAWFGDFVNIFAASSSGVTPPPFSIAGFFQGAESLGIPLIWHTFEGIALVVIGLALIGLSFKWSNAKSVRICSILAFIYVLVAAVGGALFVLSGFSDGGDSMQMGGSFVGAYALYFVTLYYAK
jgi:heme A synthase